MKQSKNVQKILSKIDRDIASLMKKYDKYREKLKETYLQEEDKACQSIEKNRKSSTSLSKSVKKIGSKKQSNIDIKLTPPEVRIKIQELQKTFSQNILQSFLDQYQDELKIFENRYEQLCNALDKAMEESQQQQRQYLNNLHDKEVSLLMKRLDSQNKDELTMLSKSHKDKNELARIKRELQQKLIDQAVNERQRLQLCLDKLLSDLSDKHKKEEKRLQDEKKKLLTKKQDEFNTRCQKLQNEYDHHQDLFLQMFSLIDTFNINNNSTDQSQSQLNQQNPSHLTKQQQQQQQAISLIQSTSNEITKF